MTIGPHVADHLIALRHVLEHLAHVFAESRRCCVVMAGKVVDDPFDGLLDPYPVVIGAI